jgi:hypothetical protein
MKKWIQKSLIITVGLLTFGIIPPDHLIWEHLLENKSPLKSIQSNENTIDFEQVTLKESNNLVDEPNLIDYIANNAKEQSYIKFGNRIGPVIQNEFDDVIFPKIQEVIDATISNVDPGKARNLVISEQPSGEYYEKIFHIYNNESKKDVIRFHVRTDKKPLDGFFFNFHYHLEEDNYSKHYALGEIYWSKNTPPKWLS